MAETQRSIDDERYRVPGTNMFSFSQWSRENIPKPPHAYPIGTVVEVDRSIDDGPTNIERVDGKEIVLGITGTMRLIVIGHHQDCDGTALYTIGDQPIGMPESRSIAESMRHRGFCGLRFNGYSEDGMRPTGEFVQVTPFEDFIARMFGRLAWIDVRRDE